MAVQIFELLQIEPAGRLADMIEVEPFDRLIARDGLVVAVAPAEAKQIVEQRLGKNAHFVTIAVDAERPVAL